MNIPGSSAAAAFPHDGIGARLIVTETYPARRAFDIAARRRFDVERAVEAASLVGRFFQLCLAKLSFGAILATVTAGRHDCLPSSNA